MVTWQLPSGHGVGVQLVGVHQSGQSFCSSSLVLIVGEVLPLGGQVGNEHWKNHQGGRSAQWTCLFRGTLGECVFVCVCMCACMRTI